MHASLRGWATPVAAALGVLLIGGCSSDEVPDPVGSAAPSASVATEPEVTVRVTRVAGTLSADERAALAEDAGGVVRDYLLGAFVQSPAAESPGAGAGDDPFATFTAGAAALAAQDRAVLTGEPYADAESVTVDRAAVRLSVVAPQRQVAGATAQVFLNLSVVPAEGEDALPVRVRGRLLLTPAADGWRIFGYDLSRSDAGTVSGEAR